MGLIVFFWAEFIHTNPVIQGATVNYQSMFYEPVKKNIAPTDTVVIILISTKNPCPINTF